jgi:hypothetical protein
MKKMIRFLFVLCAALGLFSCSFINQADTSSCSVDMDRRITIDVTDASPQSVFDQIAREQNCAIRVNPVVRDSVSLHMENAPVNEILASVCQQIDCKYDYDGKQLTISSLSLFEKLRINAQQEHFRKFDGRLPDDMRFEDVPLSSVLEQISNASGLEFTPWKDEGDRKVTMDVSGMTVTEALKAVVSNIDGEGAVMVKLWYGFPRATGQHWLWGYP